MKLLLCALLLLVASCSRQATEPDPIDFRNFQLADEYVGTIETVVERPDQDRLSQQQMPAFSKRDSIKFWFYPDKGAWFCEAKDWRATGTDGAGSRYWIRDGKMDFQAAFFSRWTNTAYNSEIPRGFYAMRQDAAGQLILEQAVGEQPQLQYRRQRMVLTKVERAPQAPTTVDYLPPDSAAYTGLVEVFIDSASRNISTGNDIVYGYTQRTDLTVWFDPQTQIWRCWGRGWFGGVGISTYQVQDQSIRFDPVAATASIPGREVPILNYRYKRVDGRTLIMEQFPFENENIRRWQRMTLKRQN